jgi:Permeases of the drug/metabolite transporter (DMT) superfamily
MAESLPEEIPPRVPSPAGSVHTDNPPKGIAIILLALLCFSCSDAAAKGLTHTLVPYQIVWMRFVLFTALIIPIALFVKGPKVFISRNPGWQLVRGLGMLGSAFCFTSALQYLPIAESMAINFISPIIITALSIPFLGEKVGPRRWSALFIGMIGVLIVVRPGSDTFQLAALFPVCAATSWAFAMIATRKTSSTDDAWTAMTYAALTGLVVTSIIVPFVWRVPSPHDLFLSSINGGLSTLAQLLLIFAYRLAPASILAPFSYSQMVWSILFGYAFFAEVPDRWTLIGAVVIISSGLYIAHREQVVAKQTRQKILSENS